MFGLFKKDIKIAQIDEILGKTYVGDLPLTAIMDNKTLEKDVLTVGLTLPKETDQAKLEAVYHTLQAKLYPLGVAELNFNVVLSQERSQNAKPSQAVAMHHPKQASEVPTTKSAPKQADIAMHPRIRHILVVASGKGGVGKSTTAVNLALALQKNGARVGILDADIYGPSVPDMLGVAGVKPVVEDEQFVPIDAQGLAMLSIGNLLDTQSTPVAWRGIKATGALMQLYNQTSWPQLDYLVIDMPPGTGDIQLTLAQKIPITAAIIVTTPQHIALLDAKKGIEMFGKTQIPVLGIVENMALHICSQCGHSEAIFGMGGAEEIMKHYGTPLLGRLPLAMTIRENMDAGTPSVLVDDEFAQYYLDIAKNIEQNIGKFSKERTDGRIF